MTEEILTHRPARTATKYVSEAFSFLNTEDVDDNDETLQENSIQIETDNRQEPVETNGFSSDSDNSHDQVKNKSQTREEFKIITSLHDREPLVNGEVNSDFKAKIAEHIKSDSGTEFSIVTYVENSEHVTGDSQEKNQSFGWAGEKLLEINPVYEVTDDSEETVKGNDASRDYSENGIEHNEIERDDESMKDDVTEDTDYEVKDGKDEMKAFEETVVDYDESGIVNGSRSGSIDTVNGIVGERSSVVVDDEVVELRKSSGEVGPRQSRQPTWRKNQHFVSEAFGFLKEMDTEDEDDNGDLSLGLCNLCGQALSSDVEGSKKSSEGQSICRQCETRQADSEILVNGETDDVPELPEPKPGITRRRKITQQSGDDDGNSSDEDKGVYRESFRKSTWLYIGDNEEIKESKNQANYISLSDLGVNTCDNDSVFGDGDTSLPDLSHKRNDSTATTLSEQEFRSNYKAVSRRIVKRADSQQEYKRFTAKGFDNVKSFVLERDSSTEFGIHVLDCKPAVISGIDAGSAAECAGLKEGQILISVNGVNVLESDHSEIIGLVQRDSKTLTVEVGTGDTNTILDLQVPVITGCLQKQVSSTIFKTWKRRYFILRRDNCLYYYKNETETDPLGAIPLNGYIVSRHGDLNKFGFKAEKYSHKTFYFMAESREQMTNWVGALNDAAQKGKSKDSWMDVTAHNVGLPALNIRNPDCSGYLFKMGRATRRWRKRYCVLKDACIYYYRNANSKEADGVAHLHGYSVEGKCVSGKKYSFSLRPPEPQMRTFCFYTDNETDKLRWVRSLNTSIKKWVKVD